MGAQDTFASLLVLMDTLRLISMVRSIRWIRYACRFINACFRNGPSCGRSSVRIRRAIWKIDQSRTKPEIVEILSLSKLQKFLLPKKFSRGLLEQKNLTAGFSRAQTGLMLGARPYSDQATAVIIVQMTAVDKSPPRFSLR
jgi:hypothetical protein